MASAWREAGGSRSARVALTALTAVVSGLLMVSCSSSSVSTPPGTTAPAVSTAPGQSGNTSRPVGVISLNAISTLRSLFNRADGHTRLVLIFSPT